MDIRRIMFSDSEEVQLFLNILHDHRLGYLYKKSEAKTLTEEEEREFKLLKKVLENIAFSYQLKE